MDNQAPALNGYVVFVEGVRFEIYAATSYQAQQKALAVAKTKKKHPLVSVHLCELAGEQVTTVVTN